MSGKKSNKKRRNKSYKPSPANPLSIFETLGKTKGFEEPAKTDIKLPVRIAFDNLRKAEYQFDDLCAIYCAIVIGQRCSKLFDETLQIQNQKARYSTCRS